MWPKLGIFLRTKVLPAINTLGQNSAVSPVGQISPPAPPESVSVNVAGEYMHISISHNAPIQKGVRYFSEISSSPTSGLIQFSQPLVIDHGTSRTSHPFPLPTKTSGGATQHYSVRSYCQYPGSQPSEPTVAQGSPFSMSGSTEMDLLPSNGSGTASNSGQQGGYGLGMFQLRPVVSPKRNLG